MSLLTAPLYAFFSKPFYQIVARSRLRNGFFYLLYLAGISTVALLVILHFRVAPQARELADWIKAEMPPMVFSPQGLNTTTPGPYAMVHPDYGTLAVFDTTRVEVSEDETEGIVAYFTQQRIYYRDPKNQPAFYDFGPSIAQIPPNQPAMAIGPEVIDRIYQRLKPWAYVITLAGSFFLFCVWKLLVVLIYSAAALLFNRLRTEPLEYSAVLNVAFFAVTPAVFLQLGRNLFPALAVIPFAFFQDAAITLFYLYFALKLSEKPTAPTL